MQQYPSIPSWRDAELDKPCSAYVKYDGSNLRWEWSPKTGWNKFGTRHKLFDEKTPLFKQAIPIFQDVMAKTIVNGVKSMNPKVDRITAFTEFFGASSFAGQHIEDEPKSLVLFDVFIFKKGFVPHTVVSSMFSDAPWLAQCIYRGNMDKKFVDDVQNGIYPLAEGVICRGGNWNCKIKTKSWLERLKTFDAKMWQEEIGSMDQENV